MKTLPRCLVLLVALALGSSLAEAQGQPQRDMRKLPIFFSVAGTERVRVEKDIVFSRPGGTDLKADIYMPEQRGRYPVVFLVSGGGVNDWRQAQFYVDMGRMLAAQGFVAVSYDKRFSRELDSVMRASEDTMAVLDFTRKQADKYDADASRFCTWHFSGGGRMAGRVLQEDSPVHCVALTYSILSFGDGDADPKIAPYSAVVQAKQRADKFPPVLVVRAGSDSQVLNDSIAAFMRESLSRNAPVTLINYPQGDHGFEVLNDTEETRSVLRQSFAWLREHTSR